MFKMCAPQAVLGEGTILGGGHDPGGTVCLYKKSEKFVPGYSIRAPPPGIFPTPLLRIRCISSTFIGYTTLKLLVYTAMSSALATKLTKTGQK